MSFLQRPDIAIEVVRNGLISHIVILDPKYKLQSEELDGEQVGGRPKKSDIDAMHSYRDSIRDHANGHRLVSYAAIIYPGPEMEFSSGLAALSADPAASGQLRSRLSDLFQEKVFADLPIGATEDSLLHDGGIIQYEARP